MVELKQLMTEVAKLKLDNFCREIQSYKASKHFIAITANHFQADFDPCYDMVVELYPAKPTNTKKLNLTWGPGGPELQTPLSSESKEEECEQEVPTIEEKVESHC